MNRDDPKEIRARLAERRKTWEALPKYTPCASDLWSWDYTFYIDKAHLCEQMPVDAHVWQNTCERSQGGGEFWVLNRGGNPEGTPITECPFCHCNLSAGQGARFLEKRDWWPADY